MFKVARGGRAKPVLKDDRPGKADAIIDLIANQKTPPAAACQRVGVAFSTFLSWVRADNWGLRDRYVDAREAFNEVIAEECFEIADDGTNDYVERQRKDGSTYIALDDEHVKRSALRIETRKWYLSRVGRPSQGYGRGEEEDDAETMNAAIAALERIATAKAASR